ncbi:hypothetical protein JCM11641_005864 [Rhodosporidiobolus odoratus]
MTQPVSSFTQQLKSRKETFLGDLNSGKSLANWTVAVGNEAGDLDSLASALAYAHFATQQEVTSRQYVPLILTARSDLALRPENTEALAAAGVTNDSLLTIDDLPISSHATLDASFALVDHNVLLPSFRSAPDAVEDEDDDRKVVAIIDHHADEGRHLAASPRLLQPVGSCAALVTSHFTSSFAPSLSDISIPSPLADLMLSAILIDTNLRPTADGGKATEIDLSAVNFLLPYSTFATSTAQSSLPASSNPLSSNPALEALKQRNDYLSAKKNDVSSLSGRDLLRRDYKEYSEGGIRYGLSTVPLPLSVWLDKSTAQSGAEKWELVLEDTRRWMEERGLALAGVLTSYTHIKKSGKEGKHRRELLLVSKAENGKLDGVFEGIEGDEVLQLEEWWDYEDFPRQEGQDGNERWRVWQQGNAKATRKQVAPMLKSLVLEAVGVQQ